MSNQSTLIISSYKFKKQIFNEIIKRANELGYEFFQLPYNLSPISERLVYELNTGKSDELGENSPQYLDEFSEVITSVVENIRGYKYIYSISQSILPLELVKIGDKFLGDFCAVSHIFPNNEKRFLDIFIRAITTKQLTFQSYVLDCIYAMDQGRKRLDQDIVHSALSIEDKIPVEILLNVSRDKTDECLKRKDISILHLDTHSGTDGISIQTDRKGFMLHSRYLPSTINIPLIMLIGCETISRSSSFGVSLFNRGVDSIFSPFSLFQSLALAGTEVGQLNCYNTFLNSLIEGKTVGEAIMELRRTAMLERKKCGLKMTLTRLYFTIVGNSKLSFKF